MGYIEDGVYHKGTKSMYNATAKRTSVWKQSDHDRQRSDHKGDLIRPYLDNGEPNPAFIELYPDESREVYKFIPTDEELSKRR